MVKITQRLYKRKKGMRKSYSVTIPITLMKKLGWQKGDELLIQIHEGDKLIVEKLDSKYEEDE